MTRIKVLDKGWIELQDVMGDDLAIVQAARASFVGESKGAEQDKKLLFYLIQHHHDSPLEMCELKFRIHAPELVWRHILRHRTGNFNLQSYRYTQADGESFYVPTVWRGQDTKNKQASEGIIHGDGLTELLEQHYENGMRLYERALELGVAREQARLFLSGFGLYSTGVVKFDLRNLLHFIDLRTDGGAQWETRQYAEAVRDVVEKRFPWTWEAWEKYRK